MDKLNLWIEQIDTLSLRERGMILLAVIAVFVFIWDSFLMAPLDSRQKVLSAQIEIKRAEVSALNIQIRQFVTTQAVDPNAANRERLAQLRIELAELESRVSDTAADMIEPARMPEVLRMVINQTSNLNLANLKGLGASPLVTFAETKQTPESAESAEAEVVKPETGDKELAAAFKHGMQIRLKGDYLTTLDYLRRMEKLEWRFFWDSLEFQVGEYPDAESVLTIYTLSLARDWIRA